MEEDVSIEKHYYQLKDGLDIYMKSKNQTFNSDISWWIRQNQ